MPATDTIVAASSPPGRSPRGLIRLTGPDVRAVLTELLATPAVDAIEPRVLTPCRIKLPVKARPLAAPHAASRGATDTAPPAPAALQLPALLAFFAGPRSYTGQDMAEFQVPGHPALLDRLVHAAIHHGARLAEPGEFTFRAYTAGKLDLTRAEGIAATISATSDSQLQAGALLRSGRLGDLATSFVDTLATTLALVEAGIDFTDQEDVVPIGPDALHDRLTGLGKKLDDLLTHSRSWGALEALPRVVLAGPPSVGKSTLFNELLGRTRAVVDALPGTTRDVLTEPMTLHLPARDGQPPREAEVMLVDIAGLDAPITALDHEAQAAARQALNAAELILVLQTPAADRAADAPLALPLPAGVPQLNVLTKADAVQDAAAAEQPDAIAVSAHTGQGLDTLRSAIAHALADRAVSLSAEMLALQPRHESALRNARGGLEEALQWVDPQRGQHGLDHLELIAAGLRTALDELAGLGGEMTPDDVIGRVFATFCVGK